MPHKISRTQYSQIRGFWPLGGRSFASRLLAGEGTDSDLGEVVKMCIEHGHNALARELLMPPDQLEQEK